MLPIYKIYPPMSDNKYLHEKIWYGSNFLPKFQLSRVCSLPKNPHFTSEKNSKCSIISKISPPTCDLQNIRFDMAWTSNCQAFSAQAQVFHRKIRIFLLRKFSLVPKSACQYRSITFWFEYHCAKISAP